MNLKMSFAKWANLGPVINLGPALGTICFLPFVAQNQQGSQSKNYPGGRADFQKHEPRDKKANSAHSHGKQALDQMKLRDYAWATCSGKWWRNCHESLIIVVVLVLVAREKYTRRNQLAAVGA